jgi:hypothetical protein
MSWHKTEGLREFSITTPEKPCRKDRALLSSQVSAADGQPALLRFSSTPLFRLEKCPDKYAHLLKKKDLQNIGPIVNYFINNSGHSAYLGGDAVNNLYLRGRKKYKSLNMLVILSSDDVYKYTSIMNNIISANDGDFSLGLKYRVRKNRVEGCFSEIAHERYIIHPRLESLEILFYPFRPAAIELDLTTQKKFSYFFNVDVRQ